MSELTAEQFAQRAVDMGLIEPQQMISAWSELGTRNVPVEDFAALLQRRELLTNWQTDRLVEGRRGGYFFGPYKVLYLVGAGTFARVYRAVHRESGDVFAVKVLRQRFSEDLSKSDQFLREASVVLPMRHPNIVRIHEVKSERGRFYMVMDFIEGQNLRDFAKVHTQLSVDRAIDIIADTVAGLDYAFQRGITHRDLKLSNVMLAAQGRAMLADFGLAAYEGKLDDDSLANVSNARSIDYGTLERATNVKKDDKRSDIFFVGCMLYQLLAGKPPLVETRERAKRMDVGRFQAIKPITEVNSNLPHRVVSIVQKAMTLAVDQRYQSPGEMLKDLQATKQVLASGGADAGSEEGSVAAATAETQMEGVGFTVMLVETNAKVQDLLRDRLKKLGYRVLVISNPQRAVERFDYERAADCVLFGTSELGSDALNAFNRFATTEPTMDVPAILLIDTKQMAWAKHAHTDERRAVVSMPLKFGQFRVTLQQLVTASTPGA